MKFLRNGSYGYQMMYLSKHTMTNYLGDEKTHKAINNQFFKRLNIAAKDLYEVELVESTMEHREPLIVGFFILQYAKLRMLELYYNFFDKFAMSTNSKNSKWIQIPSIWFWQKKI